MPLGVPIPPSPAARRRCSPRSPSAASSGTPSGWSRELDPARKVAVLRRRQRDAVRPLPRRPRAPGAAVVVESGLTVDGWIPVDPLTLETSFPDVYAVGDVTSVGTPKAGVFAEGQAAVVADGIICTHPGRDAVARYDGHGICYLEFGRGQVAKVDVTFMTGQAPRANSTGPRRSVPPTRPSSAAAGSAAGSGGAGRQRNRRLREAASATGTPSTARPSMPCSPPRASRRSRLHRRHHEPTATPNGSSAASGPSAPTESSSTTNATPRQSSTSTPDTSTTTGRTRAAGTAHPTTTRRPSSHSTLRSTGTCWPSPGAWASTCGWRTSTASAPGCRCC